MLHETLDFDSCGVSAAQKMAGEDADKAARVSQQHAQVRAGVIARATVMLISTCSDRPVCIASCLFSAVGTRVSG